MKYFSECETYEEAKKLYKKLAKENHPDLGGDPETMKAINTEFEQLSKDNFINKMKTEYNFGTVQYQDLSEVMKAKFDIASMIKGIQVEIIGSWIWLTGETLANKETLKANGFKWSAKKKAWYFHENAYFKRSRHSFTVDELRDMWGSSNINKSEEIEA